VNDWANTLQTFVFSGFTNVVSVSSAQGTKIGFFGPQETAYQSIMGGECFGCTRTGLLALPGTAALAVAGAVGRNSR